MTNTPDPENPTPSPETDPAFNRLGPRPSDLILTTDEATCLADMIAPAVALNTPEHDLIAKITRHVVAANATEQGGGETPSTRRDSTSGPTLRTVPVVSTESVAEDILRRIVTHHESDFGHRFEEPYLAAGGTVALSEDELTYVVGLEGSG